MKVVVRQELADQELSIPALNFPLNDSIGDDNYIDTWVIQGVQFDARWSNRDDEYTMEILLNGRMVPVVGIDFDIQDGNNNSVFLNC